MQMNQYTFLDMKRLMESPEESDGQRPTAIIFNSGAWDFNSVYILHEENLNSYPYINSSSKCLNNYFYNVSALRTSPVTLSYMKELSNIAKTNNVRLIYRNNHFNNRFGAFCADKNLERFLRRNTIWEIFDSRNMSHDHWKDQTFDGFHFDRSKVYTEKDHLNAFSSKSWRQFPNKVVQHEHMGELEITLAQSLLSFLVLEPLLKSPFRGRVLEFLQS